MNRELGINQLKRRDFLRAGLVFGAGASGLAAGYAAVPDAFARAVYAAKKEGMTNENILVMIQLAGGNDTTDPATSSSPASIAISTSPRSTIRG